jgi:suppressor for copper-sensitivity B
LWLLTILGVQVSVLAAATVALLMVAVVAVLWGRRFLPAASTRLVPAAIAGLAVIAFAAPQFAGTRGDASAYGGTVWQPFDEAAIPGLVAQGKIVFVDVTAEWCVTCIVNKKLVLDRGEVARLLSSDTVVQMQADWTKPDPAIADYLARNNRFGIPFDIIYGPVAPNGLILPELLNADVVMKTFNQAAGRELVPGREPPA